MKNKILITVVITIILIIFVIWGLPCIRIKNDNKIKYLTLFDEIGKYEDNFCYNESVIYYDDWDLSITDIDMQKIFIFNLMMLEYEEGNLCDYEYYLESSYIEDFLENAEIIYNNKNINLANLIKNKKPIESNTLYLGNEYDTMIEYKLHNKYEVMYIFYLDNLLVIQIGHRDEGAKFIAYE